jgi:hypothetical protein
MLDSCIVPSFAALLQQFAGCFTTPSFVSFTWLASGWVLNLRRHTVTETVRAAQAVGVKHISSFHRFFARGRWITDEVGLVMVRLVVSLLDPKAPIVVPIDDTLGRHTGKRIAAACMHHDPLLSSANWSFFHWGHLWVVLSINVYCFDKTWALPVLFRLYRSKQRCTKDGCAHRKRTDLARELVELLARTLPERQLLVVGDAAYTNHSLIKGRPRNVTLIGRSRLDAALYAPPPRPRPGRGRPRVRGARIRSPGAQAARKDARWQRIRIAVYGKTVTVRVLVIDALWYVAAGSELLRLVVVRGFPGHEQDDVFACTDPTLTANTIAETFSKRWPLEVAFHESKGRLGFEEPQNRTERAVERTAPMALWTYSLVVVWYVTQGQYLRAARLPAVPWYASKALPSFGDMLATLRRASWLERISVPCADVSTLRKRIRPILEYAAA